MKWYLTGAKVRVVCKGVDRKSRARWGCKGWGSTEYRPVGSIRMLLYLQSL